MIKECGHVDTSRTQVWVDKLWNVGHQPEPVREPRVLEDIDLRNRSRGRPFAPTHNPNDVIRSRAVDVPTLRALALIKHSKEARALVDMACERRTYGAFGLPPKAD